VGATQWRSGEFVRVLGLGFGKLRHISNTLATVEFFRSASPEGRFEAEVPLTDVALASPPTNARCFFRRNGRWESGRLVWVQTKEEGGSALVVTAGSRFQIPSENVYLRYGGSTGNPFEVVRSGVLQDCGTAIARANYVSAATLHRGAARGMTGLSSSRILLFPHQIEVCARIHQDSVQRYLLADEVGLGKTIEAGVLIRQYLLDNPTGTAVVLAPRLLLGQWATELATKFGIDRVGHRVRFVSHDDTDYAKFYSRSVGLLVVDEAHHIASRAYYSSATDRQPFEELQRASQRIGRLLLLSATPLLHNEENFLAMLHLLDPVLYPLDSIESFKQRVESRRDFAFRLQAFESDAPDYVLEEHADEFRSMFPQDDVLIASLDSLESAVDAGDSTARFEAIREARVHLTETYRLHHRVLRTRRGSMLARSFPVRGRTRPRRVRARWGDRWDLDEWLVSWFDLLSTRIGAREWSQGELIVVVGLLDRWRASPGVLKSFVRFIADRDHDLKVTAEISPRELTQLRGFRLTDREREHLHELAELTGREDVLNAWKAEIAQLIMAEPSGTVVFCSHSATAESIAEALDEAIGPATAARYVDRDADPYELDEIVRAFARGEHQYLVCDRAGEEGRNFQFAAGAFHVDLPWDPNRVEQRIGRLDRFSESGPVASTVHVSSDGLDAAWLNLLEEGFAVFDASIATLQHVVSGTVQEAVQRVTIGGTTTFIAFAKELRDRLDQERSQIAQLENLESLEGESAFKKGMFSDLTAAEEHEAVLERATERWLCETRTFHDGIGLQLRIDADRSSVRSYRLGRQAQTKIDAEVLQGLLRPFLGFKKYTFKRAVAANLDDVHLMRPGEALFDAVEALTRSDDLGQTFAFWRRCMWLEEPRLFVRAVFRVEPVPQVVETAPQHPAEQRLVEAFFPPMGVALWLDQEGAVVTDEDTLSVLGPTFRRGADEQLQALHIAGIEQRFGIDWPDWWIEIEGAANELADTSTDLQPKRADAIAAARTAFNYAARQQDLRLRSNVASAAGETSGARMYNLEGSVVAALEAVDAIADAVGLVILGDAPPRDLFAQ
jgi:ATP-dependent helicase HepA